jgi:hypothetical protein
MAFSSEQKRQHLLKLSAAEAYDIATHCQCQRERNIREDKSDVCASGNCSRFRVGFRYDTFTIDEELVENR